MSSLDEWVLREQRRLEPELRAAVDRCLFERADWVLGDEVEAFERELTAFLRIAHGVGVSSGTDALTLALVAVGVGPGDRVAVPALTHVATAVAVVRAGARPVFVDVEPERWTISPDALASLDARSCRAVIPVHLFGRAAPLDELAGLAEARGWLLVEDACQAHGAAWRGRLAGTVGQAGCFSFFPSKALGGCGDGGFVCTPSTEVAERLRRLRTPGKILPCEQEVVRGTYRLDTLQAAILRVKLRRFHEAVRRRRELARRIIDGLVDRLDREQCAGHQPDDAPTHVVLIAPQRDRLHAHLRRVGVDARVHWPTVLPDLPIFSADTPPAPVPSARIAARALLCLQIHHEMTDDEADRVVQRVHEFYGV